MCKWTASLVLCSHAQCTAQHAREPLAILPRWYLGARGSGVGARGSHHRRRCASHLTVFHVRVKNSLSRYNSVSVRTTCSPKSAIFGLSWGPLPATDGTVTFTHSCTCICIHNQLCNSLFARDKQVFFFFRPAPSPPMLIADSDGQCISLQLAL